MVQKFIDLTYPIHEGMQTYPVHWHPLVEIVQMGRHGIENRETRKLVMGTHTGTHCDAPRHFIPNGLTIDEFPVDLFIGPAVVVDLSWAQPKQMIGVSDLADRIGERRPERLLLRFDWSDHWGTRAFYRDHPFLSPEAAHWLVERGLRLIGMDTPQPDNPVHGSACDIDSPIHKIFLSRNIIIVEYLCNMRSITRDEVEFVGVPLKIREGDGAPMRCVAVEEE